MLATLEINDRIARLTLNRPEKRNALSLDVLAAMHHRVDELVRAKDVSVCILTGAGPTFCSGMDLKAVLNEPGAPLKLLTSIAELTIKLRTLNAVTIARVNGAAIGGGCGLANVCDISITHPESRVGYPEVDLGVCPAVVAPWLVQTVGAGMARRILLQGGTMTGLRAMEIGLIARCVPLEQLDAEVDSTASRLASAGPNALQVTKRLLNELEGPRLYEMVREGAKLSASVVEGEEARAMLTKAFGG